MTQLHEAPADSPVVVRADQISKHFVLRRDNSLKDRVLAFRTGHRNREEFTALEDVNIEVRAGQTVALIGHNGSGKSTLLKIIGGILDPSSGSISRRGRVAALLELGAGFHPDLSGRDNVFLNASLLGMSKAETEAVFDDIVTFAEIEEFIDTQVKFYSSGMYVRLAFAVAIHTNPDILLVDEVLAVGDEAFQRKCMDTIRRFQSEGRTILLVTHNLNQVLELSDHAVLLHHGNLVYSGEPREAVSQFRDLLEERRLEHESAAHEHDGDAPQGIDLRAQAHAYGDQPDGVLEPGGLLTIEVELHGVLDADDWICGIQVDSSLGQAVLGTTTHRLNHEVTAINGSCTMTFTFADTHLGEGKFFVNVSVMAKDGTHLFDVPQACSFNTRTPDDSSGLSYAKPQISSSYQE